MEKIKLLATLISICGLMSCEKPGDDSDEKDCCLPPLYFEGELMYAEPTSDLFGYLDSAMFLHPDELTFESRANFFLPSAFTPDADGLNDHFFPFSLGYSEFGTAEPYYFDYEFSLQIKSGDQVIFKSEVTDKYLDGWDGRDEGGRIRPGVYQANLSVFRNNVFFKQFTHYFWVLLPDKTGNLDSKFQCLTYGDQYVSRFGLLYKTNQQFN